MGVQEIPYKVVVTIVVTEEIFFPNIYHSMIKTFASVSMKQKFSLLTSYLIFIFHTFLTSLSIFNLNQFSKKVFPLAPGIRVSISEIDVPTVCYLSNEYWLYYVINIYLRTVKRVRILVSKGWGFFSLSGGATNLPELERPVSTFFDAREIGQYRGLFWILQVQPLSAY